MVNINIQISDDLHRRLKVASVVRDMTLKEHITLILQKKLVSTAPSLPKPVAAVKPTRGKSSSAEQHNRKLVVRRRS